MKSSLVHIAGIESRFIENKKSDTAVVLFHGYGANMNDLVPLGQMWDSGNMSWYFPNGVMALPMGYYEGRSWFSIDVAALEKAMREGSHRDLARTVPTEFEETMKQLEIFLRELSSRYKKIIIGGFSQGAMCASHLAMKADLPISGLILLSGNLLAHSHFPDAAKSVPFYQSHGTMDPILPMAGARALEEKLLSLNFQGKLHVFEGGHEIPLKVINEVKEFLSGLPTT